MVKKICYILMVISVMITKTQGLYALVLFGIPVSPAFKYNQYTADATNHIVPDLKNPTGLRCG